MSEDRYEGHDARLIDRRRFIRDTAKGLGALALCGPLGLGPRSARSPRPANETRPRQRLRFLVRDPAYVYSRPCFSPTGDEVLYMRAPAGDNPVATEGSNRSEWSLWKVAATGGTPTPFFESPDLRATRPDWSWTSGRIAFTGVTVSSGHIELWLIDADGSGLTRVPVSESIHPEIVYPAWYPDGESLAVTNYRTHQILKVNLARGTVEPLTDRHYVWAGMSSVSPDADAGHPLAFAGQWPRPGTRFRPRDNMIWIQRPGARPYPIDGEQGRMVWWSPSGELIAFASQRGRRTPAYTMHPRRLPGGINTIFVVRPKAAEDDPQPAPVGVTPFGYGAVHAKWSPDGKRLVCTAYSLRGDEHGVAILELDGLLDGDGPTAGRDPG